MVGRKIHNKYPKMFIILLLLGVVVDASNSSSWRKENFFEFEDSLSYKMNPDSKLKDGHDKFYFP